MDFECIKVERSIPSGNSLESLKSREHAVNAYVVLTELKSQDSSEVPRSSCKPAMKAQDFSFIASTVRAISSRAAAHFVL